MTEPITIEKIKLSGFRAFLEPQEVVLREGHKRSLAVLARNGLGKSSLVDSLEYYLHEDGTLYILGKNKGENKAGITALQHVDAKKRGIDTSVHIWFRQGGESFGDLRQLKAPLTSAARRVLDIAKVPFVIRGSNLRQFIDEPKGVDRYEMLAKWLNLRPLYTVQDNLHALKRNMKDLADDTSDASVRSRVVVHETDGSVSSFDETAILNWFNGNVLAALDDSLRLGSLSDDDPVLQELECRAEAERKGSGLDVLEKLVAAIDNVYKPPIAPHETPTGWITAFETAILEFENATIKAEAARASNSKSVFNDIWQDAERLLDNDVTMGECPVCWTKFVSSPLKSREKVRENLRTNIAKLKEYQKAEDARKSAEANLAQTKNNLDRELDLLSSLSGPEHLRGNIDNYRQALKSWVTGGKALDSGPAVSELTRLRGLVMADIERIERQQGGHTYDGALDKARRLLDIKSEFQRSERAMAVKKNIQDSLERQTRKFNDAIINHIRNLVEGLRTETNRIYKEIRGPYEKVPEIRIELPPEGAAKQRFAQLLIDFADSHREVAPGSYLSESQIHALALALQFAAIRMFNAEVKIIALDDIMLSQDEDHRSNIAAVLNNCFDDFQVIITTYDDLFYEQLQRRVRKRYWKFQEIEELQGGFGPVIFDYDTLDEEVETRLAAGKDDAGFIMRKAEEKWLKTLCEDFGTSIRYSKNPPTVSTFAGSLGSFLNDLGLKPPKVDGYANHFINSLVEGRVENLSSHFNDSKYRVSIGDLRRRWIELKEFRSLFTCPDQNCGHSRFVRPDKLEYPICIKCGARFSFESQTPPTP